MCLNPRCRPEGRRYKSVSHKGSPTDSEASRLQFTRVIYSYRIIIPAGSPSGLRVNKQSPQPKNKTGGRLYAAAEIFACTPGIFVVVARRRGALLRVGAGNPAEWIRNPDRRPEWKRGGRANSRAAAQPSGPAISMEHGIGGLQRSSRTFSVPTHYHQREWPRNRLRRPPHGR